MRRLVGEAVRDTMLCEGTRRSTHRTPGTGQSKIVKSRRRRYQYYGMGGEIQRSRMLYFQLLGVSSMNFPLMLVLQRLTNDNLHASTTGRLHPHYLSQHCLLRTVWAFFSPFSIMSVV